MFTQNELRLPSLHCSRNIWNDVTQTHLDRLRENDRSRSIISLQEHPVTPHACDWCLFHSSKHNRCVSFRFNHPMRSLSRTTIFFEFPWSVVEMNPCTHFNRFIKRSLRARSHESWDYSWGSSWTAGQVIPFYCIKKIKINQSISDKYIHEGHGSGQINSSNRGIENMIQLFRSIRSYILIETENLLL